MSGENKKNFILDSGMSLFTATVINILNKQVQLKLNNEMIFCPLPGILSTGKQKLCLGDLVEVEQHENNQYKLQRVLPRKNVIYRGNRRAVGEEILIAANADILLVIVSAIYFLNQSGYLESAMIAAKRAGVEIGLFISKLDCITESAEDLLQKKLKLYKSHVRFSFIGSALERQANLIEAIEGKTVLVVGDRSCGKTTLINHCQIGQHNSESRTLWLEAPGFRDFSISSVSKEERDDIFPEIATLSSDCYFSNCTHVHEEECRVLDALRRKEINRERYDCYQKMTNPKEAGFIKPKINYKHAACLESFTCSVCNTFVVPEGAGSKHRNHCPNCLSSIHVDIEPGDRASLCKGIMEPVSVWVRKGGEWAIIHRCKACGTLSSNRIASDDNPALLMSIAVKPLAFTPFPLNQLGNIFGK